MHTKDLFHWQIAVMGEPAATTQMHVNLDWSVPRAAQEKAWSFRASCF